MLQCILIRAGPAYTSAFHKVCPGCRFPASLFSCPLVGALWQLETGIKVAPNIGNVSQPEASEHRVWPEQTIDLFFSGRPGFCHSATLNDPGNAFCLSWL